MFDLMWKKICNVLKVQRKSLWMNKVFENKR